MPAQSLSLPDELITELKRRAGQIPLSRYVTSLLQQALSLPPTAQQETTLTEKDRQVLWGVQRAVEKAKERAEETGEHPKGAFSVKEISHSAGKYPSETRGALRKLEQLGYVMQMETGFHTSGPTELFFLPPIDLQLPDGRLDRAKQAAQQARATQL